MLTLRYKPHVTSGRRLISLRQEVRTARVIGTRLSVGSGTRHNRWCAAHLPRWAAVVRTTRANGKRNLARPSFVWNRSPGKKEVRIRPIRAETGLREKALPASFYVMPAGAVAKTLNDYMFTTAIMQRSSFCLSTSQQGPKSRLGNRLLPRCRNGSAKVPSFGGGDILGFAFQIR
jgi:hypothetical protein